MIVPTDSDSIYKALSGLQNTRGSVAVVRPDNPPEGIAGFIFDIRTDDSSDLESDIPDHYLEDNTAVQDHIALRPETVSVSGETGELVYTAVTTPAVSNIPDTLPLIPSLMPELSIAAAAAQLALIEAVDGFNSAMAQTQSLYGYYTATFPQAAGQTKQSRIYNYFYQLWKGRQLFSVETPWGYFTNMAIQSLSAKQGESTRYITSFDITFKKIRVAQEVSVKQGLVLNSAVFGRVPTLTSTGRNLDQRSVVSQNGTVGQTQVTSGLTPFITNFTK